MLKISKGALTGAQVAAIEAARKNVPAKTGTFAVQAARKLWAARQEWEARLRRPLTVEEVRARM